MENSIVTRDLSIGYDGTIIVPSLNSEIHRGKITSIIGANGCGKSTVLKAVGGLLNRNRAVSSSTIPILKL